MSDFLIENICNSVVVLRLARSEADFCVKWLDRGEGYMRTLRCQKLRPSAEALAICADRLERYATIFERGKHQYNIETAKTLWTLRNMCLTAIEQGAAAKWHGHYVH